LAKERDRVIAAHLPSGLKNLFKQKRNVIAGCENLTQVFKNSPQGVQSAAQTLRSGGILAMPTETVYGLAGDARSSDAVAAIYTAKGRPSFNPLIVHVATMERAKVFVQWNEMAQKLAGAFWPGPLTLVLPLTEGHGLSPLVTAGLDTVALRVPAHPTAHAILESFHGPVAAPSANPSGRISSTSAEHVLAGLTGKIDAILDAGPCEVGVESTIVGLFDQPRLLRAGGVAKEDIEACLGRELFGITEGISAPGQLTSHYAPKEAMRLNVTDPQKDEVYLGFGDLECDLNLSAKGDLTEAATNLFDALHKLDEMNKPIAVAPIPNTGLGLAINDRLTRAAAPKDD
jgi:L-threonylcarbamoyladenylate synthase